jgi:uncharacterized LabA/DUF88 family protein
MRRVFRKAGYASQASDRSTAGQVDIELGHDSADTPDGIVLTGE